MPKSLFLTGPGQLAALLQLAALDAQIRQAERKVGHLADAVDEDRRRTEPTLDRVRATIREASSAREKILGNLDPHLVERYLELTQQGSAAFIVPVRDGRCAGCVARLSSALVDGLSRPDTLGICARCQRMLYGRGPHG